MSVPVKHAKNLAILHGSGALAPVPMGVIQKALFLRDTGERKPPARQ